MHVGYGPTDAYTKDYLMSYSRTWKGHVVVLNAWSSTEVLKSVETTAFDVSSENHKVNTRTFLLSQRNLHFNSLRPSDTIVS